MIVPTGWVRRPLPRYGLAVTAVVLAFLLRMAIEAYAGEILPTYITFYPAVMLVALLAGFWAGIVATAATALIASYWILPPEGFAIAKHVDIFGLAFFSAMGIFTSWVAESYIRSKQEAADYQKELALQEVRKKSEKALKESERLYRAIGESIDYGVWICDSDGRNTYASESFLKMAGITQEQCSVFGWGSVLHPDDAEKTIAAWKECVRTGGKWDIVHRFRGVDGQWHHVLARGIPIRNELGQIKCWAGINLDINDQKKMEQQLQERTSQLEAVIKELESFSYTVSHDLRAPLRAIDGFSQMLLKDIGDKLDPESARKFKIISSNSRKMGQLIDDLLQLSRTERASIRFEKINLKSGIEDVWKELQAGNPDRNMELIIGDLPMARGDWTLLRQVLSNILGNAVKFTRDRAHAVIEVSGSNSGGFNTYCVKDNGAGFDMRYCDKLFEIFRRLHGESEFEGTGVGLAIVKRIVERHGGQIRAEGKPGEGATFCFTLPAGL